ncbi:poly(R)-hydroxyalkanoic acid synthase subunit PhaE [Halosegnis sp.]|uniref:poly(R)-hydroxyalkanoic acid synthase subunit PhaE n=1 Tax=Halosegnis sp. TaxID=2864959 RepID=UPI0035D4ADB2
MGDQGYSGTPYQWTELFSGMNDQFASAMEANVQAQNAFLESWADALGAVGDGSNLDDGLEGYSGAYDVWMEAAEEAMERATNAADSDDLSPNEFRDLWLGAANEAFKEVMSTDAFAAAAGQRIDDAVELRQATDEVAQGTLHDLGFATEGDVREVGERLVELERRQHEVEQKLDRVLAHLEDE